jgi:hypothetical protein
LLRLAEAEKRHESHWLELLGNDVGPPRRSSVRTRLLVFLATHFGGLFVLALMQRAEGRSPYESDPHATDRMAADERIHGEVLRVSPRAAGSGCLEHSGPPSSVPTTGWSAISL